MWSGCTSGARCHRVPAYLDGVAVVNDGRDAALRIWCHALVERDEVSWVKHMRDDGQLQAQQEAHMSAFEGSRPYTASAWRGCCMAWH